MKRNRESAVPVGHLLSGGAEDMIKDLEAKVFPAKEIRFVAVTKEGKKEVSGRFGDTILNSRRVGRFGDTILNSHRVARFGGHDPDRARKVAIRNSARAIGSCPQNLLGRFGDTILNSASAARFWGHDPNRAQAMRDPYHRPGDWVMSPKPPGGTSIRAQSWPSISRYSRAKSSSLANR